jgi:CHAT domain-containing protein/tetratricopeptide (TPR) repeat protein
VNDPRQFRAAGRGSSLSGAFSGGACPDDEMIASFVDGRLDGAEREHVADHVSRCDACYTLVRETALVLAEIDPPAAAVPVTATRPRPLRWVAPLAAALAMAIAGGVVARNQGVFLSAGERAKRPLVQAVGERRLFEPRLTGGFRYGPLQSAKRGPAAPDRWGVTASAGQVWEAARRDPTPENRSAAAAALLLERDASGAIRTLEELALQDPRSAEVASDLAAAYLVRAAQGDSAADWSEALEAAERALELHPGLSEALYNKGLALEGLGQRALALAHWKAALDKDASSPWYDDIRERVRRLEAVSLGPPDFSRLSAGPPQASERLIAASPTGARRFFERDLMPAWARRELAGETSIDQRTAASSFAKSFLAVTRDPSLLDDVRAFHAAQPRAEVARAHLDYAAALAAYDDQDLDRARALFLAAAPAFKAARSPAALWVDLYEAIHLYQSGQLGPAADALRACHTTAEARGWSTLAGRADAMLGLIAARSQDFEAALRHYARALEAFETQGDPSQVAALHARLSTVQRFLGDDRGAWDRRVLALVHDPLDDPVSTHRTLVGAALACAEEGKYRAARQLMFALRRAAAASGRPALEADALSQSLKAEPGGAPVRGSWIQDAEGLLGRLPDGALKPQLLLELEAARARALDGARGEAREAADRALRIATDTGNRARLPELLGLRARALRNEGRLADSEAEMSAALVALRSAAAGAPRHAGGLAERAWPAAQDLALLQLEQGRAAQALQTLELTRNAGEPPDVDVMCARIPEEAAILVLETFPDRTVAWVLDHAGLQVHTVALDRRSARVLVEHLLRELGGGAAAAGEGPFETLAGVLAPILRDRRGLRQLHVVSSGDLARVPWPAVLRRMRPGELGVAQAPSLSWLSEAAPHKTRERGLLLVGAPGAAQELAGTRREVDLIAAAYGRATVLFGDAAEPAAVLHGLRAATVVHVSAHTQVAVDPRRSYIDLSTPRHPGRHLPQDALLKEDLSQVSLVVLASCQGSAGPAARSSAPDSLARALLRRGVEAVVASVSDVEDEAAAAFSVRLHSLLARGEPLGSAFQDTLRALAADPSTAASADVWVLWERLGPVSKEEPHVGHRG